MREIDFVVPVYNEELNLVDLTKNIREAFEAINVKDFKIILVEDGSDDGSADLIASLNKEDNRIVGVQLSRNFGQQGAIHAGLCHSNAAYVCIMDGDQQDPPQDAANMMVKARQEGADVVYAVRASRQQERIIRKIGFKSFYRVWRFFSDIEVPLDAGEFAVMSRSVVDAILASPEIHRFNRGLRSWAGFKQVGYIHHRPGRVAGERKYSIVEYTIVGIQAVLSFSLLPIRIVLLLGVLLALMSFTIMTVNGVAILLRALGSPELFNTLPAGLVSLNVITLFFQGMVFIALGVIGEYVGRIYEQTKGRPTFLVSKIIGSLDDKS